jgi:adenosylhomocysteinase
VQWPPRALRHCLNAMNVLKNLQHTEVLAFYLLRNPIKYVKFRLDGISNRSGLKKGWIEDHSPILLHLKRRMAEERPFDGIKIGVCLPGTWQSYMMLSTLRAGGATIFFCPMFCQAEVGIELLKEKDIKILKFKNLKKYLNQSDFVYDNTAVLGKIAVNNKIPLKGIMEQTASGIKIYQQYADQGLLNQPVFDLDCSYVKKIWENKLATAFGLIQSLLKLQIFLPSKQILVLGFGSIGSGCADYLKRIGCKVSVYDIDPQKKEKIEACGYKTNTLNELLPHADIVVNSSGSLSPVLRENEISLLKNGAILVNMGGVGWDRKVFRDKRTQTVGDGVLKVFLDNGKYVYELACGYPVNFLLATGTDTETMDMVFSLAVLAMKYLVENHKSLSNRLLPIPEEVQLEHFGLVNEVSNIKDVQKTIKEKLKLNHFGKQ